MTQPRRKKTVFISGPMLGKLDLNRETFKEYAQRWRSQGWRVINPGTFYASGEEASVYVCRKRCVTELIQCDAIAMLPGWLESDTLDSFCRMEFKLAMDLNLSIHQAGRPDIPKGDR